MHSKVEGQLSHDVKNEKLQNYLLIRGGPPANACMRGHFRSRDKDGGHTIRFIIAANPMLHTDFTALSSRAPELLPVEVLYCASRPFRAVFAPVTLTLNR